MKLLIGLGNPGDEYMDTRHNIGRELVINAAEKFGFEEFKENKKLKALTAKGDIGKKKVLALLPQTFMNNSGKVLKLYPKLSSLNPKNIIIIHDDLDLPLGKIKISQGKSAGGHKGVGSMIRAIKSKDMIRIRIGISPNLPAGKAGKKVPASLVNSFILKKFTSREKKILSKIKKQLPKILETIIEESPQKAMNLYN